MKLKAYNNFLRELKELESFHKSTLYAFEETESLLHFWRRHKLKFEELSPFEHTVNKPEVFGTKRSRKIQRRKSLNEIILVRLISALEVFLVDLVRDAFLESKEPFKKQDLVFQLTHAELLSTNSPAKFYNKVINKECRKLSSSGFSEIIKYYKKHFYIDMSGFAPGKKKMEEYHERRHLLVHRLGKTDSQYRKKYNTTKLTITVSDEYLYESFEDMISFCNMVNNQMIYQLKNEFTTPESKTKEVHRKVTLRIVYNNETRNQDYFKLDYEFWAQDEFSVLKDILDEQTQIDSNTVDFKLSGTFPQIRSYTRIVRRAQKKEGFSADITKEKIKSGESFTHRILDDEILEQIEKKLPVQPWETGIHKKIASELEVSNKLVSIAIQQLIAKGKFKQQINGEIIEETET